MVSYFAMAYKIFLLSESGLKILLSSSLVKALYFIAFAVLTVSLLEWTKIMICCDETLSMTFSYKISLIIIIFLTPFFSVIPT